MRPALLVGLLSTLIGPPAYADGFDRVVEQISVATVGLKHQRIAVLRFPYADGRACDGPSVVQEILTRKLVAHRDIQVVDRASLQAVLDELKLGAVGLIDQNASYELGKVLDVDAVLTGSLTELPNRKIQISARLIRIPDGLIVAAVQGSVSRVWDDPKALPGPPTLSELFENIFRTAPLEFHDSQNLDNFIQQKMDELKAGGGVLPKPAGIPDGQGPLWLKLPEARVKSHALARGRWLYERDCVVCHGPEGHGSQAVAESFGLSAKNLDIGSAPEESLSQEILNRRLERGGREMPRGQGQLSQDDVSAIRDYLRYLRARGHEVSKER